MINSGSVVLKTLARPEIPIIIKELGDCASMRLSEREFNAMVATEDTFKVLLDGVSFGIAAITITADGLAKITVWLSDAEPKEKWIEAVKEIISKAFEKPKVFKIKWLIAESRKEMIAVAQSYNFEDEGRLKNEGPNRETLISLGLSSNGNSPESSLRSSAAAEQEKVILSLKTELREANKLKESLQKSLFDAEERNKKNSFPLSVSARTEEIYREAVLKIQKLEKEIESLQKSLIEVDKKRHMAENDYLLLKEKMEKSGSPSSSEKTAADNFLRQENTELKAIKEQLDKQITELSICVGDKIERIKKQSEIIEEKNKIIDELQKKPGIEIDPDGIKTLDETEKNEIAQAEPEAELPAVNNNEDALSASDKTFKLSKNEKIILEIAVKHHSDGITQKDMMPLLPRYAEENDPALKRRINTAIRGLVGKKLVTNRLSGTEKLMKPRIENIAKYFPDMVAAEALEKSAVSGKSALSEVKETLEQLAVKPTVPLSDYETMYNMLDEYGPKGVNATKLCEEAHITKAIPLAAAKAIVFNFARQNRLMYPAGKDTAQLMQNIIAIKH